MIKGWKKSTLGEACLIEKGKASAANEPQGPYPLVTTGAERKSAASWQFEGPAVCIPMISAYGHGKPGLKYVHYQEGKFALANILSALLIKDPKELSAKFLTTFLNFYKDHLIVPLQFGAANMSLTVERLATVPIWFPTLTEQERILCLLDEANALRKLRSQASQRMEEFVPALFYEMFGDAKASKWQQQNIGELLVISPNYGTMIPVKLDTGEWLNLRVANIQNGHLDLTDTKYVDLPAESIQRHSVKDGDLLLARAIGSREHLGKCIVVYPGQNKWAFDSHLMRVRPDQEKILSIYLQAFLTSPGGREIFLKNTRQSAVQFNINTREFTSIQIPVPPLSLQQEFAQRVQEAREIQSRQARSEERIEALYQSMLARAFAGEL